MNEIQTEILKKWRLLKERNIKVEGDLLKNLQVEFIFLSSNFEGLKLSHEEAELIVKNPGLKISADNKSLLQAKGQKLALDFIEDFIKLDKPLDVYIIKNLHQIILEEAWGDIAGNYRQEEVFFQKTKHLPVHHTKVAEKMYFFDKDLIEKQEKLVGDDIFEILKLATYAYHRLTNIHPFRDANGRVARMAFNTICRKNGLPYALIPKSGKEEVFLKSLEAADFGEEEKLYEVMASFILNSFDIMLKQHV